MEVYETIVILDSLMAPKEIDALLEQVTGIIKENGGTVRKVDKWGKKRMAYEIRKKQYGFYAAIEFEGPGTITKILESDYNYNDKVIRYLTYKYDKQKLQSLKTLAEKEAAVTESAPAAETVATPAPVAEAEPETAAEPVAEAAETAEPAEKAVETETAAEETKETEE